MEGKKKLKRILIPILAVVLIVTLTATFFVLKNKNKPSNSNSNDNTASNVLNTTQRIDLDIFNSWTNKEYSTDYNGNYKYDSIYNVSFNPLLTAEQLEKIYFDVAGSFDRNGFIKHIYSAKKNSTKRETISIVDGQFSKSKKYYGVLESGYFYGNNNKSYLYIKDESNNPIPKANGESFLYEISLTGYNITSISSTSTENNLYITERFYSSKTPTLELYSVTYKYTLINVPQNSIPNSDIVLKGE